MKMKITHLLPLFLLLLFACEEPQQPASKKSPLVDVKAFIQEQIPRMVETGDFQKTAEIGDEIKETQTLSFTEEDWEKELRFFTSANIDRNSCAEYFTIDSAQQTQGLRITYTTETSKVPVKYAEINQDSSGNITSLTLKVRRSTALSVLERDLTFAFPDSVAIKNYEKFKWLNPHKLRITYRWPQRQ
jgi:hypothetical protein